MDKKESKRVVLQPSISPSFICKSPACADTCGREKHPVLLRLISQLNSSLFSCWRAELRLEIYDGKDRQQGCHLFFLTFFIFFSNDRLHLASKIHLWGTFPIMASKWKKMKSQNDRLGRDYFWCSAPYGAITCFLRPLFFLFEGFEPFSSLQKIGQKTAACGKWLVYFLGPNKKRSHYNQDCSLGHRPGQRRR